MSTAYITFARGAVLDHEWSPGAYGEDRAAVESLYLSLRGIAGGESLRTLSNPEERINGVLDELRERLGFELPSFAPPSSGHSVLIGSAPAPPPPEPPLLTRLDAFFAQGRQGTLG